jgi:hypothetical protein
VKPSTFMVVMAPCSRAAVSCTVELRRRAGTRAWQERPGAGVEERGQRADAARAFSLQFNYSVTLMWFQVGLSRKEWSRVIRVRARPGGKGPFMSVQSCVAFRLPEPGHSSSARPGVGRVDVRALYRLTVKRKCLCPSQGPTRRERPFVQSCVAFR